jgi:FkbM family methyltransferase
VYGFEPNPKHTPLLRRLQTKLAGRLSNLTIYTETAVGGPEQLAKPMWLTALPQGSSQFQTQRMTFAALTSTKPADSSHAQPVPTLSLSGWLRRVCLPKHGVQTPVVIRMDVEGVEYDVLSDLATSGIGRMMDLYVTVEWHKGSKNVFLGAHQRAHMRMLDDSFLRYAYRCGDGRCTARGTSQSEERALDERVADAHQKGSFDTLEGGLEKTLAFFLHRAGITYVDAYYAVSAKGAKSPRLQEWNATRERRRSFAALANTNDGWVSR